MVAWFVRGIRTRSLSHTQTTLPKFQLFSTLDQSTKIVYEQKQMIKDLISVMFSICIVCCIASCATKKPAPSKYLAYETKSFLTFPLKEEAFITWGGRKLSNNHHAISIDQRFALDIVILGPGVGTSAYYLLGIEIGNSRKSFKGDKKNNESYYCFGKELVAPGKGTIVDVMDGIDDNVPCKFNKNNPSENYIVIDHGSNEFSMMAHFKKNSIIVSKGDKVKSGDVLGQCGNSGNSSEPHLHYHLQNTPIWLKGEGLPAQFNHYFANDKYIERGEPFRGQLVHSK